jgi:hypothetical protein
MTTDQTTPAAITDEQILKALCGYNGYPFYRPSGTEFVYNGYEDEHDLREMVLHRARELIALATRAATPGDTLSPDERVLFESTVGQFADCNETDTDYAVLMDWTRRGFLECVHFEVTAKGNAALAASAPTVKP